MCKSHVAHRKEDTKATTDQDNMHFYTFYIHAFFKTVIKTMTPKYYAETHCLYILEFRLSDLQVVYKVSWCQTIGKSKD